MNGYSIFYGLVLGMCVMASPMAGNVSNDKNLTSAEKRLKETFPNAKYEKFENSQVSGLYTVYLVSKDGARIVYWNDQAEVLLFGEMIDKTGTSLTMKAREKYMGEQMLNIDTSLAIKVGNGKHKVVEFLDIDCPYCVQYNNYIKGKEDVTRYIFLYNAMQDNHPESDAKSVHVLCSKDKLTALENLYSRKVQTKDLLTCKEGEEILEKYKNIASQYQVSGTPTLMING
jgi:thiol:disulfide interchange protein DsbC